MGLSVMSMKGTIEVVSSKDASISRPEGYAAYIDSFTSGKGDEALLALVGEPTRFVMRLTLPYEATLEVKDRQLSFDKGKPQVRVSFALEQVRHALVGVKNPAGQDNPIEWKADPAGAGGCHPDIVAELDSAGITTELFMAWTNATSGADRNLKKK